MTRDEEKTRKHAQRYGHKGTMSDVTRPTTQATGGTRKEALRTAQIVLAGAYGTGIEPDVHPALATVRAVLAEMERE
jgi:hypothetical protein